VNNKPCSYSCEEPLYVEKLQGAANGANDSVYIHLPFLEDNDMVANPGFWTRPERMPYIRINSWPAVVCQQIGYDCLRVRHVRRLGPTVNLFLEITISAMGLLIACTKKLGSKQSIRTSCS
jgi:hypothetical protein